jgi:hypothetical protein
MARNTLRSSALIAASGFSPIRRTRRTVRVGFPHETVGNLIFAAGGDVRRIHTLHVVAAAGDDEHAGLVGIVFSVTILRFMSGCPPSTMQMTPSGRAPHLFHDQVHVVGRRRLKRRRVGGPRSELRQIDRQVFVEQRRAGGERVRRQIWSVLMIAARNVTFFRVAAACTTGAK